MTPTNTNIDTQTTIQMPTPVGSLGIGTNQGTNGYNWWNTRGLNHKNRGKNQQAIQDQSSNFTGSNDIFKVLL